MSFSGGVLVVPFFNEEGLLPRLLESLCQDSSSREIDLVGVNHGSTDRSSYIFGVFSGRFKSVQVLEETSDLRCGGLPRNRGFKYVLGDCKDSSVPVATIDSDSIVSNGFISDILKVKHQKTEGIVFPVRCDQKVLLNVISNQKNAVDVKEAIRALIGVDWLKFQISHLFAMHGAFETRGPGGYAFKSGALRRLRHKQPLRNGRPITGENNRLGIRAKRMGIDIQTSNNVTHVSPRREIAAILQNSISKSYLLDVDKSEVFKIARSESIPVLSASQWRTHRDKGVERSLRYLLCRAGCYEILEDVSSLFAGDDDWAALVDRYIYKYSKLSLGEKEVVGEGIHNVIFEEAMNSLGGEKARLVLGRLEGLIPSENRLLSWASRTMGLSEALINNRWS